MDYKRLKAYLDDNAGIFGALNDVDAATELNVKDKQYNLPTMTGKQVKDSFAFNPAEWVAIGADDRMRQVAILSLCSRDDLNPHGADKDIFVDACGGFAPNTIVALDAARTLTNLSIADIEKFGFGDILESHVNVARAL